MSGKGGGKSPRASGGRKRPASSGSTSRAGGAGSGSMLSFYSGDDSLGKRIGPVPVLVLSLLFIAVVFILHIWGKYTRS